jgi:DNA-binding NarL/FixJ family response regulator
MSTIQSMNTSGFAPLVGSLQAAGTRECDADEPCLKRFVLLTSTSLFGQCLTTAMRIVDKITLFETYTDIAEWKRLDKGSGTSLFILASPGARSPEAGALDARISQIRALAPRIPYVVMADGDEPRQILKILHDGARGFIPTSMCVETIVSALHFVDAGGVFIPASCLLALAESRSAGEPPKPPTGPFSPRELSVAMALCKGSPNKVIAHQLNMCESTVKVHVRNIMKKLKAKNRTEVALMTNRLLNVEGRQ